MVAASLENADEWLKAGEAFLTTGRDGSGIS
jgi:hypothetical protein